MFIKKPSHRKFSYEPRHYKPQQDKEEKRKRNLGFRSKYRSKTSSKKPLAYIIMLLILLYFFLKYNGYI
jgi:ribosomal protein L34